MSPPIEHPLRHHLLDLLLDGPSSFAALFGALIRHYHYGPGFGIGAALDALAAMEKEGWVRARMLSASGVFRELTDEDRATVRERYQAWLPEAAWEDLSLDEIGLWYEVELTGRREWERWSNAGEKDDRRRWTLDDDANLHTIVVQAENTDVAEDAVRGWLSLNPGIELVEGSKSIETGHRFEMRDGAIISNGVRLVCKYGRRPSAPDPRS